MASQLEVIYLKDFALSPGGRDVAGGPNSGEQFLKEVLEPAFLRHRHEEGYILVNLDDAAPVISSFLYASFGELAVKYGVDEVEKKVHVLSTQVPMRVTMVQNQYDKVRKRS